MVRNEPLFGFLAARSPHLGSVQCAGPIPWETSLAEPRGWFVGAPLLCALSPAFTGDSGTWKQQKQGYVIWEYRKAISSPLMLPQRRILGAILRGI
jgi:hypothetical protein